MFQRGSQNRKQEEGKMKKMIYALSAIMMLLGSTLGAFAAEEKSAVASAAVVSTAATTVVSTAATTDPNYDPDFDSDSGD